VADNLARIDEPSPIASLKEGRETRWSLETAPALCPESRYFLLRRWWRVLRSNLRCFFFAIRLRRFLITEPIKFPSDGGAKNCVSI
jgi:hypothetical protein